MPQIVKSLEREEKDILCLCGHSTLTLYTRCTLDMQFYLLWQFQSLASKYCNRIAYWLSSGILFIIILKSLQTLPKMMLKHKTIPLGLLKTETNSKYYSTLSEIQNVPLHNKRRKIRLLNICTLFWEITSIFRCYSGKTLYNCLFFSVSF